MNQNSPAFDRIMHPTDFRPGGEAAFDHALKLALAARGQIHLAHADPDRSRPGPEWRSFPGVRLTLARWGLLEEGAPESAVAAKLGVRVTKTDLDAPNAVHSLAHLLDAHPADLIVVGPQVRDGLDRLMHPSVSEPLTRRAGVPALFAPAEGRGFVDGRTGATHLRNVLIPMARTPSATAAIRLAVGLSELLDEETRFHLLHVGSERSRPGDDFEADSRMRRIARDGPVVDAIVGAAHEVGADLVVMATKGHDGLIDAFKGSKTEQVLHRANRALLAVPS